MTTIQKTIMKIPSKKIELPSFPWSEVVVRKITVSEQRQIQKQYNITSKTEALSDEAINATFEMICSCIESRNFTDEEGVDMSVDISVIQKMPNDDVEFLMFHWLWIKTEKYWKNE